ncbi:hypothetical protein M434DRAFT_393793, partial [Hypoxylon sp. CO27-5]
MASSVFVGQMPSPSWTAAADHKACTLAGLFKSQNLAALSLGFSEDVVTCLANV